MARKAKLIVLIERRRYHSARGLIVDRLCTHDAGLVFRNKDQWRRDKRKRATQPR